MKKALDGSFTAELWIDGRKIKSSKFYGKDGFGFSAKIKKNTNKWFHLVFQMTQNPRKARK